MEKVLSYRGFVLSIIVLLNYRVEKRINGDKFHLIQVFNEDKSVNKEIFLNANKNLGDHVIDIENQLYRDIDNDLRESKSINESVLEKMGYVTMQEN